MLQTICPTKKTDDTNDVGNVGLKSGHFLAELILQEHEDLQVCRRHHNCLYDLTYRPNQPPMKSRSYRCKNSLTPTLHAVIRNAKHTKDMAQKNYTLKLSTQKSPGDAFKAIINVRDWWSGLHEEEFTGSSEKLNDEF